MSDDPRQLPLETVAPSERVAALGALLFVAPEPVPLTVLAQQLGCARAEARAALEELGERLAAVGLTLQWVDEGEGEGEAAAVALGSQPRFAPLVRRFLGLERTVRLSQAALETLAIVAYRQPVTRLGIEAVRGVDSSGVLQTLLARGLVEPTGRLPAVGTPLLYSTTPEFLRFFGLSTLKELPPLPEDLTRLIDQAEAAERE